MTQEEILEGNKLIAKFMGYTWSKENDNKTYLKSTPDQKNIYSIRPQLLKYHSSWDWLMPVVEKIESLVFWFNIKKNHVTVAWDNKNSLDSKMIHSEFGDQSKIERVYSCVVAFIKYHNENN